MCPECGSEELQVSQFDYGQDAETGYSDSGETVRCLACDWKGDVEDTVSPKYLRCALHRDHSGHHFFLRFRTQEVASWECPVVPTKHEEAA